ncbi:MAG: HAD-IIIA family hydrolase [Calditrichaeota bacterium]|nr:MAG: HAD-IIIA family hydrolase [Calditrichota bacterium]
MQPLPFTAKINTVIFDVGHTLLFPDDNFLFQLAQPFSPLSEDKFKLIGAKTKDQAYRESPEDPFKLWFGKWMTEAGVPARELDGVFNAIWDRHNEKHLWSVLEPSVPHILSDLRDAGYKLGVISNSDGSVTRLLQDFQLDFFFECILDSAVVGIEKPDARIFLQALEALQSAPAASLYVGDHMIFDINGAQNVGMWAVLLDPYSLADAAPCPVIQRLSQLKSLLNIK